MFIIPAHIFGLRGNAESSTIESENAAILIR
jgi:hypothetical protein